MRDKSEAVKDKLLLDSDRIFKRELDRVSSYIRITGSGEVLLTTDEEKLNTEDKILLYLIGAWFGNKGEVRDSNSVPLTELSSRVPASRAGIKRALKKLEDQGMIIKQGSRAEVEPINIESILDDIEEKMNDKENLFA